MKKETWDKPNTRPFGAREIVGQNLLSQEKLVSNSELQKDAVSDDHDDDLVGKKYLLFTFYLLLIILIKFPLHSNYIHLPLNTFTKRWTFFQMKKPPKKDENATVLQTTRASKLQGVT